MGPGDSPEILGVWTASLPFLSISEAAWEMHTICWQPQASSSPQPGCKRAAGWACLSISGAPARDGDQQEH